MAFGVAYLALGSLDAAVDALEDAAQQLPDHASGQSDLAAAYAARAASDDRAEDWPRALAASDRAIALDATLPEPRFNRALALEGLYLSDEALDAWDRYTTFDATTPWAAEARTHARALREKRRRTAAMPKGRDHQTERERVEDDLLTAWGRAVLAKDDGAAREALIEADRLATEVATAGGDAMARDEVVRIHRAAHDRGALGALAAGHDLYGLARRYYNDNRQQKAADVMEDAARSLSRAASAYAAWAPIYRAIFLRNQGQPAQALDALARVRPDELPAAYHHLRGRLEWTSGVAHGALGRFDAGREHLRRAVDEFTRAEEPANIIATRTILTESEGLLGDRTAAWRDLVGVLKAVDGVPAPRRNFHFLVGANLAAADDLPEAVLEFQNCRVRVVENARDKAEAYVGRARTRGLLGDIQGAMRDLDAAQAAAGAIQDSALADRNVADIHIARAEVLAAVDAGRGLDEATAALEYVHRADPAIRLASLLTVRAKCRLALNDVAGAEEDLQAAVQAFEAKRSTLATVQDRAQAFQQERGVYRSLVQLEVARRADYDAALAIAERARAGVVLEAWRDAASDVDPRTAHRALSSGVAIVYYEALSDRVLAWVLTRERVTHFECPIRLTTLRVQVGRIQRVIQAGGSLAQVRAQGARLYDSLIDPALQRSAGKSVIVFVPDGPLFSLPFGVMPDAAGRPLIATRTVGVAPSLATFLAASAKLGDFSAESVLAVGDGHDPAIFQLPVLLKANEEAAEVGALYPIHTVLVGPEATKRRLLAARDSVVHFAGHTVVNLRTPVLSHMLLAADSDGAGSATMMASEIGRDQFGATRVVVLATCDGAVGRVVDGEGVISIARAFFAAGVPSVVASLWPVDDNSHDLLVAFHRQLRRSHDAALALRAAQMDLFTRGAPVRAWAGFIALGGASPAH